MSPFKPALRQTSFFDLDTRNAKLSKLLDPSEKLSGVIDWKFIRPIPEDMEAKPCKSMAGRKPINRALMLKVPNLRQLHCLADERIKFQI